MTIPSRPAPAPPAVAQSQNAAASDTSSIEQLRRQLEQQQRQQQQNGGIQKLTIKLPPPPKSGTGSSVNSLNNTHINNNNNYSNNNNGSSSITRKFPKARYAPATNWDDAPFDVLGNHTTNLTASMNGNVKKVPPPRPPPPKVQVNGRKASGATTANSTHSSSMLTNIFQRKKTTSISTKAAASNKAATRIYGVSSGNYNSSNNIGTNNSNSIDITSYNSTSNWSTTTTTSNNWGSSSSSSNYLSNSLYAFNSAVSIQQTQAQQDAQLISFDSPPSSPTFTQKSNSDCVSVDSFSSDSNFSTPHNGSVSQPESGFEDDFSAGGARSRPATTSPLDPWETFDGFSDYNSGAQTVIGTAPVRNLNTVNTRLQASIDNPLCNGKSLMPAAPSLNAPTIIKPKISQKPKAPKPPVFMKPTYQHGNTSDLSTPPSPPMPQCPPPPLPSSSAGGNVSLLDVITGKVDAIHLSADANAFGTDNAAAAENGSTPYGVALYDFDSMEEGDLNFRENEKIYLLEQVSDEWYRGRTRTGCEGIFPGNYIDIKVPLSIGQAAQSYKQPIASIPKVPIYVPQRVRCLFNFPAEVDGDLILKENDLVTILYRINEDWLYGEVHGRQGQFPANFLEYVPDNIPLP